MASRNVRTSAAFEAPVLDPAMIAELLAAEDSPAAEPGVLSARCAAHAWGYEAPSAWVDLRAEALAPADTGGVIREALLTTGVDPRAERSAAVLPSGWLPTALRRWRSPFLPARRWNSSRATASLHPDAVGTRDLDPAEGPGGLATSRSTSCSNTGSRPPSPADLTVLRPQQPGFSMPCLALAWKPPCPSRGPSPTGACTHPRRPVRRPPRTARPTGRWSRSRGLGIAWRWRRGGTRRDAQAEEMLRGFAARLTRIGTEETSLAEWLTRLDTERWPIVVDRISLAGAGWGPLANVST